jgi:hypothetical protein
MSKNPAWNAYNESVRKISEEYEAEVKPLRVKLSADLAKEERRFDDKINPLVMEKGVVLGGLKDAYSKKVADAEKKRREAVNRAQAVLNAELAAAKNK